MFMVLSFLMSLEDRKRKLAVSLSAIALFLVVGISPRATGSLSLTPAPAPAETHGPYTTTFSRAENPISEGGKWRNGQTDGLDWTDVRTTPGFAFGTEIGGDRSDPQTYHDTKCPLKRSLWTRN